DDDVRNLRLVTDAIHRHGSLAGVELWYGGHTSSNLLSREIAFDVDSLANTATLGVPAQSQAMSKRDIAEFRKMYREAASRALAAGFDIVYVYSNHEYLLHNFLSTRFNTRSDEYGGSLENRTRLLREVIEDVGNIISGRSALAVRYSVPKNWQDDPDELVAAFKLVAELPDLWDITVSDYRYEMGSSQFVREAAHQDVIRQVKMLTSKPVVSVGRFTSPDTMLSQISGGVQDFIGAARPSIADPFLPAKINQGRIDDIRECIGCNVCYAYDSLGAPIRCTQNPTMGEEWRRGWHPDRIAPRHADESVLIVGAGPAGLEAACALGQRGYKVTLAEAEREPGGRLNFETRLPGLAEWARVRDWRLGQIVKMTNVDIYPDNRIEAASVVEMGYQHVLLATGASWRADGVGRWRNQAFSGYLNSNVVSVGSILRGHIPAGPTLIFDDDHYYLGPAIALHLRSKNIPVTLVTPANTIASWGQYTSEHSLTMEGLIAAGVEIVTAQGLIGIENNEVQLGCVYSGRPRTVEAEYLIPLTSRIPEDGLWQQLDQQRENFYAQGGLSLDRIGDCRAPGIVAAAVYAGHKYARELGSDNNFARRDRVVI
ncbi:MAG: dimethylamine/trimethylamine dehydrogenase, partial [Planctomycetota bacterium]